ncbi:hypothetical protein AQS8620_02979 [Aquimixticola soesokkakensis]|uniref:UPF0056 membrane protein n=1 Tax=Aquimixticola soesokkakensis TaxID=1519096 RepID=A0A1Y5TNZ7_9RHOB|nr:MarC family protein [Aquimixticola soesokkakensis]SLN64865.1 hypothetical protein AQS8620_02979 [Aquimixticola soesokkakensis]
MDMAGLIAAFFTLFVVIDPIGLAPLFVALTQGESTHKRRVIAVRAVAIAAFVLVLFGIFGEAVLGFAGISMGAFRIAGGILLFLTALDMLFERRTKRRGEQAATHDDDASDDPSVFPLATPLIAGPGAIASMILLMDRADTLLLDVAVIGVLALVLAMVLVFFLSAGLLERLLGVTGTNVVTRLLGMLLAALSVQFVIDGLREVGTLAS